MFALRETVFLVVDVSGNAGLLVGAQFITVWKSLFRMFTFRKFTLFIEADANSLSNVSIFFYGSS